MGNGKSRVIQIDDVEEQLSKCQLIDQKNCQVYGKVHFIRYKGMEFYLGQSSTNVAPHHSALHYLVQPDLLMIPPFTLLEQSYPDSLQKLLDIISGVAEVGINGQLGIGYGRIAYSGRWGIVGEKSINWAYQQICQDGDPTGVFLSPQLMLSYCQGKTHPKHDPIKSDVFAFGIMLVEIIFIGKLKNVFDYQKFQIKLNPLLETLSLIKDKFGDSVYQLFVGMFQIQQQGRLDFEQIYCMVESIKKPKLLSSYMTTSNKSKNMENSRQKTPTHQQNYNHKTPATNNYRNDVSPFRARFAGCARVPQRLGKTPQRSRIPQRQTSSRSPLRRDLKINTRFDKQNIGNRAIMTPKQQNYPQVQMGYQRGMYSPISRR